jgi:hypothetical protein
VQEKWPGYVRQANCPTAGSTISVIATLKEQNKWYEAPDKTFKWLQGEFISVNLALTYLRYERFIIAS